ncbi:hypothetical protein [Citrobacter sp. C411]|uniref:hypothetical protein n=1 Tax=Citrobacter sp. C411 TaxID=3048144 RepID=UPI0039C3E62A
MDKIRVVGIDIAKSVFQVCVWMVDGSVAWNRKISRQKLLDTLRQFEPGTLGLFNLSFLGANPHFDGI